MICFITCNGYEVVETARHDVDAPARCREIEIERDDGYAVYARRDGRIIADAEGWCDDEHDGGPPYDAATATGMYDRDF